LWVKKYIQFVLILKKLVQIKIKYWGIIGYYNTKYTKNWLLKTKNWLLKTKNWLLKTKNWLLKTKNWLITKNELIINKFSLYYHYTILSLTKFSNR